MKKSMLTILTVFSIMFGIYSFQTIDNVNAIQYCSEDIDFNGILKTGASTEQANMITSCVCNNASTKYASCKDAQNFANGGITGSTEDIVKVYRYSLATNTDANGKVTSEYQTNMNDLINLIESIINASVGVIIFILAFGFLWNVTQMGMYSSNPQQRVMCLKRLGDVFGTAFFIGCIPMIMKLLLGLIALL